jgi:hypothetical protein
MHYLQGTGDFVSWRENRDKFQEQHVRVSTAGQSSPLTPTQPDDPKLMWEQMKTFPSTSQLANFALLLLDLVANQASNERSFSDLKIKKTRLRNRLGTKKLEKMSKVSIIAIQPYHYSSSPIVRSRHSLGKHRSGTCPRENGSGGS